MTQNLVVIGLGYVGLPLAQAAALSGFKVTGLDLNKNIVSGLTAGKSHIDDLSDLDIKEMLDKNFNATTDSTCIGLADVVVICVPTPLSTDGGPDLGAVISATKSVSENLKPGSLVILESTTYPGTTEEIVLPILEKSGLKLGEFELAFSPERIDPGNQVFGMANTPKVVGGLDIKSGDSAVSFYSKFVETVVRAKSAKEAEMAKLLENTYRHVNIALMNELVEFSNLLDIDLWNAIDCAATKPFGFQAFYPGPGVGGHCIPIDPNYLAHHIKSVLGRPFKFVELAQEINQSMPAYVVSRIQDALNDQGKALKHSKILLLGVTYKANIADQRESPVRPLARELLAKGADVRFVDPFVQSWNVDSEHGDHEGDRILNCASDLDLEMSGADIVVLLQNHKNFDLAKITATANLVLDTRGVLEGMNVVSL
jgi:UDP-N-acetyl-D-glucosamine dehydrogenase